MEVPRLGGWTGATAASLHHSHSNVGSKPHLWLPHSSWQHWILNPRSEAKDQACVLTDTMLGSYPAEPQKEPIYKIWTASQPWTTGLWLPRGRGRDNSETGISTSKLLYRKSITGAPLGCGGGRIQCGHYTSLGHCQGSGPAPTLGTSTCHKYGQKINT